MFFFNKDKYFSNDNNFTFFIKVFIQFNEFFNKYFMFFFIVDVIFYSFSFIIDFIIGHSNVIFCNIRNNDMKIIFLFIFLNKKK